MLVGTQYRYLKKPAHLRAARNVLASKSKSFNWAAKLLSPVDADRVALLYAFCRYADDIADNMNPSRAREVLTRINADLEQGASRTAQVQGLLDLLGQNEDGMRAARILVATLFADTGDVRILSWDQLIRYAYGVAGTVGMMMCAVLGAHDAAARPFAIDLGIGMQLTNIARDVAEDALRDRIYLPAEALPNPLGPQQVLDPEMRSALVPVVIAILKRADAYYRSAHKGMRYLPLRSRAVVLTAARIYEAIGLRILPDVENVWESRVHINRIQKGHLTLQALIGLMFDSTYRDWGPPPLHDPRLHAALKGLPGAHGEGA